MARNFEQSFPTTWKIRRLDEVSNIMDSLHKTPVYSVVGDAMVRVTDIKGGFLDLTNSLRVAKDVFQEFTRRYAPKRGDIVISRVGSYGNASYVNIDTPFCLGQNTALISPHINGRFIHQFLQSAEAQQQIEQAAVGSTQKTISLKSISALQIPIPPRHELEAIAHVLGTLDDKIELNRRMNETLEAMASALFKAWFVDFEPVRAKMDGRWQRGQSLPGLPSHLYDLFPDRLLETKLGKIPTGWRYSTIGQEVTVCGGATPSTKESEFWEGGQHCWCTPKDLSALKFPILLNTDRKITDAGIAKISSGLLPIGTVLLSSRAPIGYLAIAEIPTAINQGFIAMKCDKFLTNIFVLLWCRENMDMIIGNSNGSTFQEISKRNFRPISIIVPSEAVLAFFTNCADSIYRRMVENERESCSLAQLRNTLLPKLISGELRVPDAERLIGTTL